MSDRRIESLRPEAQPICRAWLEKCRGELALDARITETWRSVEDQVRDQGKGASSVKLGWHQFGLAWDFAVFDHSGCSVPHDAKCGVPVQRGDDPRYAKCGGVATALGCKWPIRLANGDVDSGHIEYRPNWRSLKHLIYAINQGSTPDWAPPPKEGVA